MFLRHLYLPRFIIIFAFRTLCLTASPLSELVEAITTAIWLGNVNGEIRILGVGEIDISTIPIREKKTTDSVGAWWPIVPATQGCAFTASYLRQF